MPTTSTAYSNPFRTTYRRDGSVSVWNVYEQCWQRVRALSDRVSASLASEERARIERHFARAPTEAL